MTLHHDAAGFIIRSGNYVHVTGWSGELFRIKEFQSHEGGDAIVENVIPGGRLRTSTLPTRLLTRAINNPYGKPSWWDDRYDAYVDVAIPGTILPCGCYMRASDTEAMLCDQHLTELNGGR